MNDDPNKSHVGMSLCYYCGESKEVLLDRRLRNTLPHAAVYDREPCDDCQKLMEQGVMFIGVRNGEEGDNPHRTGHMWVIKDDAVADIVQPAELLAGILKQRVAFVDEETCDALGLTAYAEEVRKEKADGSESSQVSGG